MTLDDPELLAEFVAEAREHLADVESQLLDIEASGADVNVELVNTVFRAVHSIKGAAGFMGLTTVNKLAHSLENVLGKMRNHELVPNSSTIDAMLRAADALNKLINNLETSNAADVSCHIETLERITDERGHVVPNTSAAPVSIPVPPTEPCIPRATTSVPKPAPATPAITCTASSPTDASIRVPVGVLDRLMNLAGELVLGRNQLVQTLSTADHAGIEVVVGRLSQVTSELQEAIMQTRMQPIGNVFTKFPRLVRDLTNKLGKYCDVTLDGKEVEVDKTIVEAIGDPLTHLVRNAVDHGIELPADRSARGKSVIGAVKLRAYHRAGKVRIDVIDDGGGIDPARLRQKAVALGVISTDQSGRMSDRDAIRLIFHPGFSTAEHVTDVSGRGVGMDVVRTNIEKLGGTVDVDSTLGRGTTIQITLPLTLAIIPSLIIESRGERFAIPQVNVLELVRVKTHELEQAVGRVKHAEVLRLRGALLPLLRLGDVLRLKCGGGEANPRGPLNIVVMETGQHRYAVVVDEILDSEEIVVKPLGRHVKSCVSLAGATILGDGHVALILDAVGIASVAGLSAIQEEQSVAAVDDAEECQRGRDPQDLLLFSYSPTDRFAVPMSLIARIERVAVDQIEVVGRQRMLQYHGSVLPLLRLDDYIATQPARDASHVYVIVFRAGGREAGLLAPQLEDIRQLVLEIDAPTHREKGVAGVFVVDETTTRLLDVVELAELAHPEWFVDRGANRSHGEEPATLLIAEDSPFFRGQLVEFLQGCGYEVVACVDGVEAWDYLTRQEHDVRLVITDLEMPQMDGFELCGRLKEHPRLHRLPVIALTSLANEADMRRGREAGVDDYQVKMDREQVEQAVSRLLGSRHGSANRKSSRAGALA